MTLRVPVLIGLMVPVAWAASSSARPVPRGAEISALAGGAAPASASATPVASVSELVAIEAVTIRPALHVLDGLSGAALDELVRRAPEKLGPVSVGRPNRGRLLNPVTLEPGPGLKVMNKERSFATEVTARAIREAVLEVAREFSGSPELEVGDISSRRGGYIRPHRSHQAGVDADIGFYYSRPVRWYTKANASNLDRARTWAFVKALVASGTVEYVFVDRSIQALLREYALANGESPEFLDALFENRAKKDALIRHAWGHLTHFHVRFMDPAAEETGRRVGARLKKAGRI